MRLFLSLLRKFLAWGANWRMAMIERIKARKQTTDPHTDPRNFGEQ